MKNLVITNERNGYCDIEHEPAGHFSPLAEEVEIETARDIVKAVNAHDILVKLAREFSESIENNPDEGSFRNCCGVRYDYNGDDHHAPDCHAIAALKAAGES